MTCARLVRALFFFAVSPPRSRDFRPELALVGVTAVWGVTFVAVRAAMGVSGPLAFVALRFALAAALLGLLSARRMRGTTRADLRAGAAISASLAVGYGLQTAGLVTLDAGRSAFITALYVPLVPLAQWLLLGRRPAPAVWLAVGLAFAGLVLITGAGAAGMTLDRGTVLTLIATLAFTAEILLIGAFAGRVDPVRVTVLQLAFGSGFCALAMLLRGEPLPPPSPLLVGTLVGMAIASAGIQSAMNWAQRAVSPARATVIYAGEPVWAALAARLAGERLGPAGLAGAAPDRGGLRRRFHARLVSIS